MPPKYQLYYYDARARGELARIVLAQADVEYEDVRIPFNEWSKYKKGSPSGQCPWLVVDGQLVLWQSMSIVRYLAREHGLMGKNDLEATKIDMLLETINDLYVPVMTMVLHPDWLQPSYKTEYIEKTMPEVLTCLEKTLEANNGGNGFFVGDTVSAADLVFAVSTNDWFIKVDVKDGLDKYPKLKALQERVEALPNVAKWLKKRPKTDV